MRRMGGWDEKVNGLDGGRVQVGRDPSLALRMTKWATWDDKSALGVTRWAHGMTKTFRVISRWAEDTSLNWRRL